MFAFDFAPAVRTMLPSIDGVGHGAYVFAYIIVVIVAVALWLALLIVGAVILAIVLGVIYQRIVGWYSFLSRMYFHQYYWTGHDAARFPHPAFQLREEWTPRQKAAWQRGFDKGSIPEPMLCAKEPEGGRGKRQHL